jgi:hypothetical protein
MNKGKSYLSSLAMTRSIPQDAGSWDRCRAPEMFGLAFRVMAVRLTISMAMVS